MPSRIDIIMDLLWKGNDAARAIQGDLSRIDQTAKQSGTAGGGLDLLQKKYIAVTAAAGAAVLATKTLYNELERAAGLELAEQRFDRLAISIGTTGDVLRDDLAEATQGLLSEAEQLALVTDIIGLGLVETGDDAVRLARVMTGLGSDINQVTQAISNRTTARFDQIGIAAVGFEDKLEDLENQGYSTQAAFTEAFLQQGEEQLEKIGGIAGTAAGEFQRFEAAIKDLRDEAGRAFLDVVILTGGLEDLGDATDEIAQLTDQISEFTEEFEKLRLIGEILKTTSSPVFAVQALVGGLDRGITTLIQDIRSWDDAVRELTDSHERLEDKLRTLEILDPEGEFEGATRATNDAAKAADEYADRLDRVAIAIEEVTSRLNQQIPGLERSIALYKALVDTQKQIPTEKLSGLGQAGDLSQAEQSYTTYQESLTDIAEREGEQRADIEEQYEEQRTDIVESYSRQRAREEEDWQLRRRRSEEDFRRSIADVQESAAEAEADARERANEQLEDLERDHLKRVNDIIDNAAIELRDAAANLDARAVARIEQRRDKALRDEQESYEDQKDQIQETLDEQLKDIRDNMAERLRDLEEFHRDRQRREEEDRAIRLRRLEEDHQRQLSELDANYNERLRDLEKSLREERRELKDHYRDQEQETTQHYDLLKDIQKRNQDDLVDSWEDFWDKLKDIAGSATSSTTGNTSTSNSVVIQNGAIQVNAGNQNPEDIAAAVQNQMVQLFQVMQ